MLRNDRIELPFEVLARASTEIGGTINPRQPIANVLLNLDNAIHDLIKAMEIIVQQCHEKDVYVPNRWHDMEKTIKEGWLMK